MDTNASDMNGDTTKDNEDDRKIFVGGLSWETKEPQLKEYMELFGAVDTINLKKDPETERSRGFAFVVFKEASSVDQVLSKDLHELQGKKIDPKRANPRGKYQDPPMKKVYVAKVSPTTTEDQIKEYFGQWGTVEKIEAPFDKEKDQRRNFVFVEFSSEQSVEAVLKHTETNPGYKHKIGSDEVEVRKATPTNRGRGRGGFFRGSDRGRGRGGGGYGYGGWNDGYQGYGGGYGGYGNNYGGGYGGYGNYNYGGGYDGSYGYGGGYGSGWGDYSQGYNYGGYGGYDYSGGWGYDQSGGPMGGGSGGYGKAPKPQRGGGSSGPGYRPY